MLLPLWGAAVAAHAAMGRVFANCIITFCTSSPDSHAAWLITARSACTSSEVPSAAGHHLATASSFLRPRILLLIAALSFTACRQSRGSGLVIFSSNVNITARRPHTFCTISVDSDYLATCNSTSWHRVNLSCVASNPRPAAITLRSSPNSTQFSTDTRATLSCCSVSAIAMNQAHLLVPIICVDFGRGWCSGCCCNQWYCQERSCCCCCCCGSLCQMGSNIFMSFAITRVVAIGMERGMSTEVTSLVSPEHWVDNIETTSFSGCICQIHIPRGGNS